MGGKIVVVNVNPSILPNLTKCGKLMWEKLR